MGALEIRVSVFTYNTTAAMDMFGNITTFSAQNKGKLKMNMHSFRLQLLCREDFFSVGHKLDCSVCVFKCSHSDLGNVVFLRSFCEFDFYFYWPPFEITFVLVLQYLYTYTFVCFGDVVYKHLHVVFNSYGNLNKLKKVMYCVFVSFLRKHNSI